MASVNLAPTSQNAAGDWTDEAGGTSDLHLLVDEATASPGTDYIRGTKDGATAACYLPVTSPAAWQVPTAGTLNIRHSRGGVEGGDNGGGNDTHTLLFRIWDSAHAVALTDEITVETGTVGYLVKTENIALAGITGTLAQWTDPHYALRTTFAQSAGKDGDWMWVDLVNIDFTYTPNFTGTLAVSNANDAIAASGTVGAAPITGTLARTNADDSVAASGAATPPAITGTLATTNSDDSVAASGTVGGASSPPSNKGMRRPVPPIFPSPFNLNGGLGLG